MGGPAHRSVRRNQDRRPWFEPGAGSVALRRAFRETPVRLEPAELSHLPSALTVGRAAAAGCREWITAAWCSCDFGLLRPGSLLFRGASPSPTPGPDRKSV